MGAAYYKGYRELVAPEPKTDVALNARLSMHDQAIRVYVVVLNKLPRVVRLRMPLRRRYQNYFIKNGIR